MDGVRRGFMKIRSCSGLVRRVALVAAGGVWLCLSSAAPAAEWGLWRDFLAQELTPGQYEWARVQTVPRTLWQAAESAILPDFAAELLRLAGAGQATTLEFRYQQGGDTLLDGRSGTDGGQFLHERSLQRQLFSSGVSHRLDETTSMSVAVVLARQQFGSATLGFETTDMLSRNRIYSGQLHTPYNEVSHGTGLRFGFATRLYGKVGLSAEFQSRIDMEGFASFNGVFAAPSDLDIPARMTVGMNFPLAERFQLKADVQRVMYSEISAFPSRLLPPSFLSLLGDSNSPAFEWSDRSIYRFGWIWQPVSSLTLDFTYATRAQPLPSSELLAGALQDSLARNSFTLAVTGDAGRFGEWMLNTAYAPTEYAFGGNVLGVISSELDKSLEVEFLWRLRY